MKPIFDSVPRGGKVSRSVRWSFAAGSALVAVILLQAVPAAAQDYLSSSMYQNNTGTSQTQLNLVLTGDISSDVAATLNPFGAGGTYSTSYDATANATTLSFLGSPVAPSGTVNVGLDDTLASQFLNAYWGTSPTANLLPAPSFSVSPAGSGPNTAFLLLYSTATGMSSGEWTELPVPTGQPFNVNVANNDTQDGPLFSFNVGYQFSNTEIPLDDLNSTYESPSDFTPLPSIPEIDPGTTDTIMQRMTISPEPSSIALFSLGAIGLLARRRMLLSKGL
jgi:hypothetical protein